MNTLQSIQQLMAKQFGFNPEALKPEVQLESLGIDSLSLVEFLFDLQDELKIEMPDDRVVIKTIGDIVNAVDEILSSSDLQPLLASNE